MTEKAEQQLEKTRKARAKKAHANSRRPSLESVLGGIREGKYDKNLTNIMDEIEARRETVKEEIAFLVRETLGDDWGLSKTFDLNEKFAINQKSAGEPTHPEESDIELDEKDVIRAPKLSLEDDPLSEEDESRSPVFGSIEDKDEEGVSDDQ